MSREEIVRDITFGDTEDAIEFVDIMLKSQLKFSESYKTGFFDLDIKVKKRADLGDSRYTIEILKTKN